MKESSRMLIMILMVILFIAFVAFCMNVGFTGKEISPNRINPASSPVQTTTASIKPTALPTLIDKKTTETDHRAKIRAAEIEAIKNKGYSLVEPERYTAAVKHRFFIGCFEVTQGLFTRVTGYNPSHFTGELLPVENVSWYEAVDFCNQLSLLEGLQPCYSKSGIMVECDFSKDGYRLPAQAEWESAAQSGYSNTDDLTNDILLNAKTGWYKRMRITEPTRLAD